MKYKSKKAQQYTNLLTLDRKVSALPLCYSHHFYDPSGFRVRWSKRRRFGAPDLGRGEEVLPLQRGAAQQPRQPLHRMSRRLDRWSVCLMFYWIPDKTKTFSNCVTTEPLSSEPKEPRQFTQLISDSFGTYYLLRRKSPSLLTVSWLMLYSFPIASAEESKACLPTSIYQELNGGPSACRWQH